MHVELMLVRFDTNGELCCCDVAAMNPTCDCRRCAGEGKTSMHVDVDATVIRYQRRTVLRSWKSHV